MKTNKNIQPVVKADVLDELLGEVSESEKNRVHMRMRIAANIDDLMKQFGLNKVKLANMLDKHPSEITKWLSGTHNFTTDTLADISLAMGVSLEQLVALKQTDVVYTKSYYVEVKSNDLMIHNLQAKSYLANNDVIGFYPGSMPSLTSGIGLISACSNAMEKIVHTRLTGMAGLNLLIAAKKK